MKDKDDSNRRGESVIQILLGVIRRLVGIDKIRDRVCRYRIRVQVGVENSRQHKIKI